MHLLTLCVNNLRFSCCRCFFQSNSNIYALAAATNQQCNANLRVDACAAVVYRDKARPEDYEHKRGRKETQKVQLWGGDEGEDGKGMCSAYYKTLIHHFHSPPRCAHHQPPCGQSPTPCLSLNAAAAAFAAFLLLLLILLFISSSSFFLWFVCPSELNAVSLIYANNCDQDWNSTRWLSAPSECLSLYSVDNLNGAERKCKSFPSSFDRVK